ELAAQREKTDKLLAEMKEKLDRQQETSVNLDKQLVKQTQVVDKYRKTVKEDNPSIQVPEMVDIKAGQFMMGSEKGNKWETPWHMVTIASPFQIGKYEVTFEEYDTFALATGRELPDDEGWGRGKRPVVNVSWYDAKAYAKWLSEQTGQSYRLPSEAEWEYAVRAETETKWYCGDDEGCLKKIAWYNDNSDNKTHPVGKKRSNAWGLHDMSGNVWEWVEDDGHENYRGAPDDGSAWVGKKTRGSFRVFRGGSWGNDARRCRSAYRSGGGPGGRGRGLGFRLSRSVTLDPLSFVPLAAGDTRLLEKMTKLYVAVQTSGVEGAIIRRSEAGG
ncbi:MAG: formylglycine-generating enzyme family protein, partial [Aestuariibacter sp.]|nr:formylglycine-generating enzyme family protein [Aestuariibacter sp.]